MIGQMGCASVVHTYGHKKFYGGTMYHLDRISYLPRVEFGYDLLWQAAFTIVDLPLCVAADTLLIPYLMLSEPSPATDQSPEAAEKHSSGTTIPTTPVSKPP